MKKLCILLLILICNLYSETDVVVYGDIDYPPYSYLENEENKGIYTEILATIFSRMPDYNVSIVMLPWKRGLKKIESGEGFALFPPYKREKQRPFMQPYSHPILLEEVTIIALKSSGLSTDSKWPEDFYGKTIGMNFGFLLGMKNDKFLEAVETNKISIDYAQGNLSNLNKLLLNRIDFYMNEKNSIKWTIKYDLNDKNKSDLLVWGPTVDYEEGYLGFTIYEENFPFKSDFINKFNNVLDEMKNSGEIDIIIHKYMKLVEYKE